MLTELFLDPSTVDPKGNGVDHHTGEENRDLRLEVRRPGFESQSLIS